MCKNFYKNGFKMNHNMKPEIVFKQLFRMDGSFVITLNGVEVFDGNMDIHGSEELVTVEGVVNNTIKVLRKVLGDIVDVPDMECDDLDDV